MTVTGPFKQLVATSGPGSIYVKADAAGPPTDAEFSTLGVGQIADGIFCWNTVDKILYGRAGNNYIAINTAPQSGYQTIQNSGTALTRRTTMNLKGAAIVGADDGVNFATVVTASTTADQFQEATKPSAAGQTGRTIFVTDAPIGAKLQLSDGTTWRGVG